MAFLGWSAFVIFALWTLAGAILFAPIFLFFFGMYALGIFIFGRIKSYVWWRAEHGKIL
ncbi:MAG: hypothetical protein KF802_01240 [Bdellovibrionaceae bacterium]|nr:hypothetical protein [Pseudobdellovibrionaceae bacterium]